MSEQWTPDTWETLCMALAKDKDLKVWYWGSDSPTPFLADLLLVVTDIRNGVYKASLEDPRESISFDTNEPMYKCTVCGREGLVGRCCGDETRELIDPRTKAVCEVICPDSEDASNIIIDEIKKEFSDMRKHIAKDKKD